MMLMRYLYLREVALASQQKAGGDLFLLSHLEEKDRVERKKEARQNEN